MFISVGGKASPGIIHTKEVVLRKRQLSLSRLGGLIQYAVHEAGPQGAMALQ
jgi:hypothetical protein